MTSVGNNAFEGCAGLTGTLDLTGVTSVGNNAFANCGFTSVNLAEGLLKIGDSAFAGCMLTGTLVLPSTLLDLSLIHI